MTEVPRIRDNLFVSPYQKGALVIVCMSILVSITKLTLGLPDLLFYGSLALLLIAMLLFLIPFALHTLEGRLRANAGHYVYKYFADAGLTEADMRKVLAYAKEGHKLGFTQSNEPPFYQVMLTMRKFDAEEQPEQKDYYPWDEVIEYLENKEDVR